MKLLLHKKKKKFLSKHLLSFFEIEKKVDEFTGKNEITYSIPIFKGERKNREYNYSESLNLKLKVTNSNDVLSYSIDALGSFDQYSSNNYASLSEEIHDLMYRSEHPEYGHSFGFQGEILLLTKNKERFSYKFQSELPEDSLSQILVNTTKFRATIIETKWDKNNNLLDGDIIFNDFEGTFQFPFSDPFNAIRFVVNNGNLSDEEIDELYDNIQQEIEKAEEKKQKESEKKNSEKIKRLLITKESKIKELNLCEFDTISAIISNPSSLKDVSELITYCKNNDLQSKILNRIDEIPQKYDTKRLLDDIARCKKKSIRFSRGKVICNIIMWLGCISFLVSWLIIDNIVLESISSGITVSAFILEKIYKRQVSYNEYTSNFINAVFK